jgi:hypothetical protein
MNWFYGSARERGSIESYEQFRQRNIKWWRENRGGESRTRKPYYEKFLGDFRIRDRLTGGQIVGEIGPGPFGGMIEVCQLRVAMQDKVFIDYIMKDLVDLNFISWPAEAVYVHAAAEEIPLASDAINVLLSFNCLDHGWDIWATLLEAIRISQSCFLAFDCRGDDPNEVKARQNTKDLDHFQLLKFEEIENFVEEYLGRKGYYGGVVRWHVGKTWPVAVVLVDKKESYVRT